MNDWQPPGRRVVVAASEKPAGARRRHFRGGLRLLGVGALLQCLA